MNPRHGLGFYGASRHSSGALRWAALALALPILACGEYRADPEPGGGTGAAGGSGGSSAGTGGSGGSSSGAGGSASGSSGSGGGGAGSGGMEQPPEPSCENVTACAGDPTGVWFAQKSCLPVSGIADVSELGIGCDQAPISGEIEVTGNFTVVADGSISDNTTSSGEMTIELEPECLDVSGTVTECSKIGIPLASGGFDTVECVDSTTTTGGCTCTGTFSQSGGMGYILAFNAATSGTHTSANNTLTVTGTSTASHLPTLDYAHCVNGNFMMVTPTTATKLGQTKGTVVLQKQP
jgi:hypothetical protein